MRFFKTYVWHVLFQSQQMLSNVQETFSSALICRLNFNFEYYEID